MLSVVIPVRDGESTLPRQLEALARATPPAQGFEVVVVDNGSSDRTQEVARAYLGRLQLRVVDASARRGANVARNQGVRAAVGEGLLFCDADDEVDVGWLVAMERALAAGHVLVAGLIDYGRLNTPTVRASRGAESAGVTTVLGFLPTGHLANLAVVRHLFDSLGGFDEAFGGGDDVDFCWRAQLAGAELHEDRTAVVHYRLRDNRRDLFRQARVYGSAEALLFRKFRDQGLVRRRLSLVLQDFWWLSTRAPFAWPASRRGAWLRRAGTQVGRVEGASQHRVWWV